MHASPLHYFPITGPFLLLLFVLFVVVLALVQLGILEYAYAKIGIQPRYVFALLLLSLLAVTSTFPVAQIPEKQVVTNQVVSDWGVQYVVPEVEEWPQTVIAVNVGGALIPTILSIYLLFKNRLFIQSLVGVAIVAVIVNRMAHAVLPAWELPCRRSFRRCSRRAWRWCYRGRGAGSRLYLGKPGHPDWSRPHESRDRSGASSRPCFPLAERGHSTACS